MVNDLRCFGGVYSMEGLYSDWIEKAGENNEVASLVMKMQVIHCTPQYISHSSIMPALS
jgi:hypothetical protein